MVFTRMVARPLEYLAITGFAIKDVKLAKKAWIFPGQTCTAFNVTPANYRIEIQAMSVEKLPFLLAAVFTIGPGHDDKQSLLRYAKLISSHDKLPQHVRDNVKGVLDEQIRVLAAPMTLEKILKGIKEFKQDVLGKVQLELRQFGLLVYHANFKELVDVMGHEYISCLRQKMQQEAENQAKLKAEARMKREKERAEKTRQNAAKVDTRRTVCSAHREEEGKKDETTVRTEVCTFETRREVDVSWAVADWGSSNCGNSDCGTSSCGFSASTDNYC